MTHTVLRRVKVLQLDSVGDTGVENREPLQFLHGSLKLPMTTDSCSITRVKMSVSEIFLTGSGPVHCDFGHDGERGHNTVKQMESGSQVSEHLWSDTNCVNSCSHQASVLGMYPLAPSFHMTIR